MANLFERPIAANPIRQFEALPLQYIDAALNRRQTQHEKAKAEIQAQSNSLLKLQYLSGDAERHHQIQQELEAKLDDIVESANGDYSNIMPQLDRFSRELNYEVNYGELAKQQANFNAAMKMKEDLDKRYADEKVSQEGYNMFLESIGKHKTVPTETGFSTFQGYIPSPIVDPMMDLRKGVNEIHEKYTSEGMKFVSPEAVQQNVLSQIQGNSGLSKALQEKYYSQYSRVPEEERPSFAEFVGSRVGDIVRDKWYQEQPRSAVAEARDSKGNIVSEFPGAIIDDVAQPQRMKGSLDYTAGSVAEGKELLSILGLDTWEEHRKQINKPEIQKRIKYMAKKYDDEFPSDPYDQRNWIADKLERGEVSSIVTRGASKKEHNQMNKDGMLLSPNVAVYDRSGRLLEEEEVKAIQGRVKSSEGSFRTSSINQVVTSGKGYPPGTLVINSHDGNQYFAEPNDPELISSPRYNMALIDMASDTNTGYIPTITTKTQLGEMPPGTYSVEHVFGTDRYRIYKNGKLAYIKGTGPSGVVVRKVEKEE